MELIADTPVPVTEAIVGGSRHSTKAIKGFVRRVLDGQAAEDAETAAIFAAAFTGADFAEGAAAFVAKRKPVFRA